MPSIVVCECLHDILGQRLLEKFAVALDGRRGDGLILVDDAEPKKKHAFSFGLRVKAPIGLGNAVAASRSEVWRQILPSLLGAQSR